MPMCKALGCKNTSGKSGKSLFSIPNPTKSLDSERLCKQWLKNIKNPSLTFKTFRAHPSLTVCEDHFEDGDYCGLYSGPVAQSLNFQRKRKRLRPGAVPRLKNNNITNSASGRLSAESISKKRYKSELKKELDELRHVKRNSHRCLDHELICMENEPGCPDEQNEHGVISTNSTVDSVQITAAPSTSICADAEEILIATKLVQEDEVPMDVQDMVYDCAPPLSSCGHPCLLCHRQIKDHSYARPVTYRDAETQTDTPETESIENICIPFQASTPCRKLMKSSEASFNSFASMTETDDSRDITITSDLIDSESEDELLVENNSNIVGEKKYLVFDTCLDELVSLISCPIVNCRSPVCVDDVKKEMKEGSVLKIDLYCVNGHHVLKWSSQPMIGRMPAGNLLFSAAILFSGMSFCRMEQLASFFGLQFFSATTFNKIQRSQLMPVVLDTWQQMQGTLLQKVKDLGKPLRLAGDGRCDSPGFSAKYCTYSLLDLETNMILTYVVVQVTETGSSSRMEAEGFRKCMEILIDKGFSISVLATDRHVQIRSLVKKNYDEINHQFDVWHLGKTIKKKLTAKAKAKGAEDLQPWIRAVVNHLWWCAKHSEGNMDWLEECWMSIVHHCANIHSFPGEHITECLHPPLDPEVSRRKKWLGPKSKAMMALKEVVLDKRLRKDIRQLSEFCHTGQLEVYHSLMTKYVPKRQEFDYDQMAARTALVAIDHNMSQNRKQKVDKSGEKVYRLSCPKATSQWVAKPIYEEKNYDWVKSLMDKVVMQKEKKFLLPTTVKKRPNIAPHPAPKKSDVVCKLKSRFST